MNLRDLWDNVVLRDILGYIVPGIVTMFAIALLVGGITGTTLPGWVTKAATKAGLSFLDTEGWRSWRPWMAASLVVPLAYAIGHLQVSVAEYAEKPGRPWYTGSIALEHLKDNRLRLEYYSAAVKILPAVRSQDLRRALANRADDCSQCRNGDAAQDPRQTPLEEADDCRRCRTADAAKHLFLLCDRYVLRKDRDIHSMFMGRYYILAAFFTNLGLSLIALAVSALLVYLTEYPLEALFGAAALIALMILLAASLLKQPAARGAEKKPPTKRRVTIWMFTIAAASLLCGLSPLWWPVPGASLLLLGIGVLMIMRSSYFRKRFVECTFPIFYAIVQAEEKSEAGQA